MHFARTLRAAGLPVGPGKTLDALEAVRALGLYRRDDFYWALHSVFVNRRDQREIFDQAFHVFWRNPRLLDRMMSMILPTMVVPDRGEEQTLSRRLTDALMPGAGDNANEEEQREEIEFDAVLTFSDHEVLQTMDFEQMSTDEVARAKAAIARMRLPLPQVHTRRFERAANGERIDMRQTLRACIRSGSNTIPFVRKRRRKRPPPFVILCDISGSMSRYSRMLLHFAHAVSAHRTRVHSFVFGTRLTNVTRHLGDLDVDIALDKVSEEVEDWSGGTRIGQCLRDFNHVWSRRVCGQGAVVLLISDGLDRDSASDLGIEMERLHKSCRHLIWLNPLLRYDQFQPKAVGIRAILPHVDDFRPVHNLESLTDLIDALGGNAANRSDAFHKARGDMRQAS
ncbi:MAG: VWA domain-containing protein [Pseudomonadota bacterium]